MPPTCTCNSAIARSPWCIFAVGGGSTRASRSPASPAQKPRQPVLVAAQCRRWRPPAGRSQSKSWAEAPSTAWTCLRHPWKRRWRRESGQRLVAHSPPCPLTASASAWRGQETLEAPPTCTCMHACDMGSRRIHVHVHVCEIQRVNCQIYSRVFIWFWHTA